MSSAFKVSLLTPIGKKEGVLTLVNDNGSLSGSIRTMGSTSKFSNGKISDDGAFQFSGILQTGPFHFTYKASGTVTGNTLAATAVTDAGKFRISGTRINP